MSMDTILYGELTKSLTIILSFWTDMPALTINYSAEPDILGAVGSGFTYLFWAFLSKGLRDKKYILIFTRPVEIPCPTCPTRYLTTQDKCFFKICLSMDK